MVTQPRLRPLPLSGLLVALAAACAFPGYRGPAPPGPVEQRAIGCYDVAVYGWTRSHTARLGFAPPSRVELDPREVTSRDFTGTVVEGFDPGQGGAEGRLMLPVDRDLDARWRVRSHPAAPDSLFLVWYGPAGGMEVGLRAFDDSSRGTLRLIPEGYADDLGPVRLGLTRRSCAQSSS